MKRNNLYLEIIIQACVTNTYSEASLLYTLHVFFMSTEGKTSSRKSFSYSIVMSLTERCISFARSALSHDSEYFCSHDYRITKMGDVHCQMYSKECNYNVVIVLLQISKIGTAHFCHHKLSTS